ncbi:hypothetical protein [Pseudogulbenkiania subflava]|uniref:Uncharacterized protein n=1 Tax=Pseudogulbenkiania subflava DSM 22618 TaxID=1123014 RepID=A0A1Y6BNB5_9NEIS|nr:hypothetical protein [Pseudogulbenkiania subflava]SMF12641.1 hypothetical protein SAMN02745746_01435 [Pseudogulbenkiania subflava DSM 22618]
MLKLLAVLALSTLLWWGALWWLIPVDWQQVSPTVMLLTHLLPPLLLTALGHAWRLRQEKREQAAAQVQAESEAAAQQARRDEAREQHLAALRERQQMVSCRWLLVQAVAQGEEPTWLDALAPVCQWTARTRDEMEPGEVLDGLMPWLEESLQALYAELPGAASLPLLLEVLPRVSGIEQVDLVRQCQEVAWLAVQSDMPQPASDCRFLPGSGTVADRVMQFLAQDPELPGAVVLAADAPLALQDEEEEPDAAARAQWRQLGRPGAAVVLLLFLRDGLAAPADSALATGRDLYQPYWEREGVSSPAGWGRVPEHARAALAALPHLASLAQSSSSELPQQSTLQLTRQLQPLLDNALVNAALLDYPFSAEEANPQRNQADSVAWLVHNCGEVDVGGTRLAAIASNLTRHQIGLLPVDEASNLAREWGDVGVAAPAMLAALAVTHSARLQAPAVITQFRHDHVALALARPALQENVT